MEPLTYLAHELEVISRTPALFTVAVVTASIFIWRLMEWKYSDAKDRIALRDDKIKALESKLEQLSTNAEAPSKNDLADYLRKDEPIDSGTF